MDRTAAARVGARELRLIVAFSFGLLIAAVAVLSWA
jgi:hypothetical protein